MPLPIEDVTRRGEGRQAGLPTKGEYVASPPVPAAVVNYADKNQNGVLIGSVVRAANVTAPNFIGSTNKAPPVPAGIAVNYGDRNQNGTSLGSGGLARQKS